MKQNNNKSKQVVKNLTANKNTSASNILCIDDKFLRIGDEVIMNLNEKCVIGNEGIPNDTKGVVVGFQEYLTTYNLNTGKVPGVYRGNGRAIVKWETGKVTTNVIGLSIKCSVYNERIKDDAWNTAFDEVVKRFDLPKFDYMVGNIVKILLTRRKNGVDLIQEEIGTVINIKFDEVIDRITGFLKPCDTWKDEPIFSIKIDNGGFIYASLKEILDIVDRGNFWAWENDKSQLKFKDLGEQCIFYAQLGKRKQVKSPRSNNYAWTIDDAVEAVRKGEIDMFHDSGKFLNILPITMAYKFDEDLSDFSKQVRDDIINKFTDVSKPRLNKYYIEFTIPGTDKTITAFKEVDYKNVVEKDLNGKLIIDFIEFDDTVNIRENWKPEDGVQLTSCQLDKYYLEKKNTDQGPAIDLFTSLEQYGWNVDWSNFNK